jgi:hypothetical protein
MRSRVSLDSIRREVAFLAGLRGRSDGLAPKQTPIQPALHGKLVFAEAVRTWNLGQPDPSQPQFPKNPSIPQ